MNSPPPLPYYSGNPTKEGGITPPPYPPPLVGVASLPINVQQQPFIISPSSQPPLIMTRPIQLSTPNFELYPIEMDCPYCCQHIVTETTKKPGKLTWMLEFYILLKFKKSL
uniref:LITAF domain-containing protein n=1 Tax=Meloidogyne javanica TaxID=6303 RepID=A0A915N1J0_MELJA